MGFPVGGEGSLGYPCVLYWTFQLNGHSHRGDAMSDRPILLRTCFTVLALLLCAAAVPANPRTDTGVIPAEELDIVGLDPELPVEALIFLDEPGTDLFAGQLPIPQRIEIYRERAFAMQDAFLQDLELTDPGAIEVLERYWLLNVLRVQGKPKDLKKVGRKKNVRKVARGGQVRIIDPETGSMVWPEDVVLPWNLTAVEAPACWSDGFDGTGVVVGHLDTGVDVEHPALAGKFAGYWLDAVKGMPTPYDDHGHGTHTLGVMIGGDGDGPAPFDIGVAPGARWVGAKVLDSEGVGSYAQCLAGLEFMAELKAEIDLRVVCGSWSLDDEGRDLLADACRVLLELEILPVFAVGNGGPSPRSAEVPGCYPSVLGVGALDENGRPARFSGRGPAPAAAPWFVAPAQPLIPAWAGHKPDLTAPGVRVLSSLPDGAFGYLSGTSVAAPHVAGAVAVLLQKNAALGVRDLTDALITTARGVPGVSAVPGNAVGYGALNVQEALDGLPNGIPVAAAKRAPAAPELAVARRADGVAIRYAPGSTAPARLDVYDLTGRRIRTLAVPLTAGPGTVVWHGRDAAGREVGSGVYLIRLRVGDATAVRKVAWVR